DARLGPYDTANDVLPLTAASPALESGIPTLAGVRDQLGQLRPADADCNGSAVEDLGAVEYQPSFSIGGSVFSGCRVRGFVVDQARWPVSRITPCRPPPGPPTPAPPGPGPRRAGRPRRAGPAALAGPTRPGSRPSRLRCGGS